METYFGIRYEFDKGAVHGAIEKQVKAGDADYIVVADGVIVNTVHRNLDYRKVVNGGMFAICDSSYVPLYLKWIYGIHREQYCGSDIFNDIVRSCRYRMFFMGASQQVLDGLRRNLLQCNPDVANMEFYELPFCNVEEFDYPAIARRIEQDGADIVWVSLGAPKQEIFMNRLKPHLKHGVMIAVGAAFKFYSGIGERRAPQWVLHMHLEFAYRILQNPRKQLQRCWGIVGTLPSMLRQEYNRKKRLCHKPDGTK